MDLIDIYQQKLLADQSKRVGRSFQQISDQRQAMHTELSKSDERIERLSLITEAAWQLLSEKVGLTEADLLARVEELDMMDGRLDSRRQRTPKTCECGAKINPKSQNCLFCGAEAPERSGFDSV